MKLKLTILLVTLAILLAAFAPVLGVTNFNSVSISDAGPTAQPALKVNQNGAGKVVEFLDGGTPVFSINNGGGIVASTIMTQGATLSGLVVSLPTAATTATPAAIIDSAAAGSNLLEARKNATPVFVVGNSGAVTGLVYQAATAGQKCVNGTQTITGSATIAHGLSTPVAALTQLTGPATGDGYTTVYTNAAAVITVGVFGNQATPEPATTPRAVAYWICGTP